MRGPARGRYVLGGEEQPGPASGASALQTGSAMGVAAGEGHPTLPAIAVRPRVPGGQSRAPPGGSVPAFCRLVAAGRALLGSRAVAGWGSTLEAEGCRERVVGAFLEGEGRRSRGFGLIDRAAVREGRRQEPNLTSAAIFPARRPLGSLPRPLAVALGGFKTGLGFKKSA